MIVTKYVPGVVELSVQDDDVVALAVRLTAVAGQMTVSPVVGVTTEVRVTLPAKLKVLVRDTEIDAPVAPVLRLTGLPTDMVKSPR